LAIPESDSYGTLGGYIVNSTKSIPKKEDLIAIDNFQFIIQEATNTKIEVIDSEGLPLEGADIVIERQYPPNWTAVNRVSTNFEGKTTSDFVQNTVYYRFKIYYAGNLIKTTERTLIFSSILQIQVSLNNDQFAALRMLTNTSTSLYLDNSTGQNMFVYSYAGSSAKVKGAKLLLYRRVLSANDELIAQNSSNRNYGTLTVNFEPEEGVTYIAQSFIESKTDNEFYLDKVYDYSLDKATSVFLKVGLISAYVFVGTFAALASSNPVAMILFTLLSLVFVVYLTLVSIKMSFIVLIVAVGGLIAFLIKKAQ
jgi:hypothetical protein